VNENMNSAFEQLPESFARVIMLYIDCQVDSTPVKAFVDSGAQQTIMSQACAERCGIMRLVDRRYAGIAKGVGTARIIGRVHLASIKIGGSFFPCSFTILEDQSVEFLLGLDMLRRHQCCIDLKANVLRIGGEAVPFLAEKDLSPSARGTADFDHDDDEAQSANPSSSNPVKTEVSEAAVQQLVSLGFAREDVQRALSLYGGNADAAAAHLFQGN